MSERHSRYQTLLPDIIADLVHAELRARAPAKFSDVSIDAVRKSENWRTEFSLDSLDRVSLANACAEFFNVYDSGREDTLLGIPNCERWSEIVALSQAEATHNITFRSSGSTGEAKHFRHLAGWLDEEAALWAAKVREAGRTRIVTHVPLHHIYGYVWVALLAAASGLPFVRQPTETLRAPQLDAGDLLVSTPHLLESWIARGVKISAPDVIVVTSTGRFTQHTAMSAQQSLAAEAVWEIYGSSETGGLGIRETPAAHYRWLPHFVPMINDEQGVEAVTRMHGDTSIAIGLPDAVSAVDATHFSVGARSDEVAKIRGHRIELAAIRALLNTAPLIADANIRVMRDGAAESLKVFLVARDPQTNAEELVAQTRAWLAERWQHAGYVSAWRVGDSLPRNAMGKLSDW